MSEGVRSGATKARGSDRRLAGPSPGVTAALVSAAMAFVALPASAQLREPEPWEPDLAPPAAISTTPAPGFHPVTDVARAAIRFYQTDIGSRSVARCPYAVSCSRFAANAIEQDGLLLGLLSFVDRFFFRENAAALQHYGWARTADGQTRLDDTVR